MMHPKLVFHVLALGTTLCVCTASFAADTKATEKTKTCFNCTGSGEAKCIEPRCKNGQKDCPSPCLKLHVGVWEKRNVPGHTDPNERWQKVRVNAKQTAYISSGHLGEVMLPGADGNARPVKCKTCGGSTTVPCTRCKGKGTGTCTVCNGKKSVPESWSAFDYPTMKNRPKKFVLKDGRTLIGRDVMISGDTITIRTQSGDEKVKQSDIASQETQKTQPN